MVCNFRVRCTKCKNIFRPKQDLVTYICPNCKSIIETYRKVL